MRTKPYIFFERGRWKLRYTNPIDSETRDVMAVSFDRACQIAAWLVRRHGLVTA